MTRDDGPAECSGSGSTSRRAGRETRTDAIALGDRERGVGSLRTRDRPKMAATGTVGPGTGSGAIEDEVRWSEGLSTVALADRAPNAPAGALEGR